MKLIIATSPRAKRNPNDWDTPPPPWQKKNFWKHLTALLSSLFSQNAFPLQWWAECSVNLTLAVRAVGALLLNYFWKGQAQKFLRVFLLELIAFRLIPVIFRMSEKGGWKKGGHFMAVWRFAVICFFEITGLSVDHFGLLRRLWRVFSNDKFPHSSSAPPKHDCHWFTLISLINLAFSTKLCSQEGCSTLLPYPQQTASFSCLCVKRTWREKLSKFLSEPYQPGGYDGFQGEPPFASWSVAVLAVVRGKHPSFASWSAWRLWRMSVFATFICFVPPFSCLCVKKTWREKLSKFLSELYQPGGYDGFQGEPPFASWSVAVLAVSAVVRGKHPSFASWSAWRLWRMSVFATFICFVPHQSPKTAKRKSAELRMAVLTLLKEHSVWTFCDHSCFVALLAVWECSIWRFWRFQFRRRLGTTDQTHTTTSATRPQDHKWKPK